jgi:acyl-CoA dehydrogenase
MYAFEPNEEQKMLIDAIYRYANSDLRPKARDAEEQADLPAALIEKGWELGTLQASIPEQYGGFGDRSALTGLLATEEMAWGDLAGAMAVMVPGLFAVPILLAGSPEQKEKYLAPIVAAEWKPYSAALIEMSYDFDPCALNTTVQEDDESYVITGNKVYVPYADRAEYILVYARLGDQTQGFIIPKGIQGLSIGERQKLLGVHALPVFQLHLDGVRVPKTERLGGPGGSEFEPVLDASRLATTGLALGVARAAFEYARDYAKDREAFGMKIAQKQAIAFMLAEMAIELDAIRMLAWEAAWMADTGKPEASKNIYLALTGATDMVMMVTDRAVQILGGHGYIREHPVEMWMRNGRGIATLTGMAIL